MEHKKLSFLAPEAEETTVVKFFWHVVAVAALILLAIFVWRNWENGSGSSVFRSAPAQGSECDRIGERRGGMECRW